MVEQAARALTLARTIVARPEPGLTEVRHVPRPDGWRPLGEILVERGAIRAELLERALLLQRRRDVRLGQLLKSHRWIGERTLAEALALQRGAMLWRPGVRHPDLRMIDALGPDACLRHGVLPLGSVGGAALVASFRSEDFERTRAEIEAQLGPVRVAIAEEQAAVAALLSSQTRRLSRLAEARTEATDSCRDWSPARAARIGAGLLAALAVLAIASPAAALGLLVGLATLFLLAVTGLRTAAAVSQLLHGLRRSRTFHTDRGVRSIAPDPVVSILVPLFREGTMVADCVRRLLRLTYPAPLLDIVFVVEDSDTVTRAALSDAILPPHMRTVVVPEGSIRTKPRALNYALDFCRGSVIGIYDAEDAPEPDQVEKVVADFARLGPEVACLQGRLDFYNARQNWLSRCFTLDYAAWFRVILPGLSRLGFAIPLGGTTLFFRREALEALGRWDAHNVTEDADLGIRLARRGYRTELLDSTTYEEANCRAIPWIRQRSRWLKGYALTYAVHMRDPRRLWRELGPKRFAGFQVMMFGTPLLFLLAPVLWSFWLIPLGIAHPLEAALPRPVLLALAGAYLLSEVLSIAVSALAVAAPRRRWLIPWAFTMQVYFALGAFAALKAAVELVAVPFFWDKTPHGVSQGRR